jgi:hypothetical protein
LKDRKREPPKFATFDLIVALVAVFGTAFALIATWLGIGSKQ